MSTFGGGPRAEVNEGNSSNITGQDGAIFAVSLTAFIFLTSQLAFSSHSFNSFAFFKGLRLSSAQKH
jgi:hypothetical protein